MGYSVKSEKPNLMVLETDVGISDADIRKAMTGMHKFRECVPNAHVVVIVHGYDEDSRELWEIPEVAVLFQRLVASGFISYLDISPSLSKEEAMKDCPGFGSLEVWLIARGEMKTHLQLTADHLGKFQEELEKSNEIADQFERKQT